MQDYRYQSRGSLLISCVLAMVPLGPLGSVMIALATSLLEEPRKRLETTGGRP